MRQSKQLALMFLLGAVLVGGAMGFTVDRFMMRDNFCPRRGDVRATRERFAESLELNAAQRAAIDTILDGKHRQMAALLKPIRPQMEAISDSARAQMKRVLDPRQQARLDEMHREMVANAKQSESK
jgi:Spy/CpxP family protein refolding chaperone